MEKCLPLTVDLKLFKGKIILFVLHFNLQLFVLHLLKEKNLKPFKVEEKFPLKCFWILALSFSDLQQAHPANLPQQVLRRLPAKRHGVMLVVLFMV